MPLVPAEELGYVAADGHGRVGMEAVLDEHLLPRFFKGEWLMDIEVTLVAVRPERPSRWERTRAFFETFGAR